MKILLTGVTGFIGSQIARELVRRGHSMRVVARPGSDRFRVFEFADRMEWVDADLFQSSEHDLSRLCASVDLCIHSAWYAVPGKYLEAPENLDCVQGSLRLLSALGDAGCRRAVFVGTCFEYDFGFGYLSESTPTKPASLYAAAKIGTRLMGEQIAKARGIAFAWVRPFYQYGPFEDSRRLVPFVIDTLLEGEPVKVTQGFQVRDYLHVEDVGSAIAAVALSDIAGIVNIGSGHPVTVREIISTVSSLLGKPELIRFGARPENPTDPPFICANNRRLVEGTGWSPRFELRAGLEDTIASRKKERAHSASPSS
jgi:nucleoside-diphosphate-sugar epimerase